MSMTNVMNEMGKFGTGVIDTANAAEQAAAWLGQTEQAEPTEQEEGAENACTERADVAGGVQAQRL